MIGFLGLSIGPMPHRLMVAGRTLHAWCAFDTLFVSELVLGKRAEVQSECPTTGEQIRLAVEGTDVTSAQPADAVVSYLHKDKPLDQHVINTFCHYIHFFANADAAAWTVDRGARGHLHDLARRGPRGRPARHPGPYPGIFTD